MPGSVCTTNANYGLSVCAANTCGDGTINTASPYNEQCDDGNRGNGDGCDIDCQVESLYTCGKNGYAGAVSKCEK